MILIKVCTWARPPSEASSNTLHINDRAVLLVLVSREQGEGAVPQASALLVAGKAAVGTEEASPWPHACESQGRVYAGGPQHGRAHRKQPWAEGHLSCSPLRGAWSAPGPPRGNLPSPACVAHVAPSHTHTPTARTAHTPATLSPSWAAHPALVAVVGSELAPDGCSRPPGSLTPHRGRNLRASETRDPGPSCPGSPSPSPGPTLPHAQLSPAPCPTSLLPNQCWPHGPAADRHGCCERPLCIASLSSGTLSLWGLTRQLPSASLRSPRWHTSLHRFPRGTLRNQKLPHHLGLCAWPSLSPGGRWGGPSHGLQVCMATPCQPRPPAHTRVPRG